MMKITCRLVFVLCWLTTSALALTPAELVTPQLEVQRISLSSIRGHVVSYFDATRSLRREPVDRFVQLRAIGGRAVQASPHVAMVILNDGQQLAGRWAGVSENGQQIRWTHSLLGEFLLPLDRITAITWAGRVETLSQVDDWVVLRNGDRVRGFITAVGKESVSIVPKDAKDAVTLDLDQIAQLQLANPPPMTDARHHQVVLLDDSRLNVLTLELSRDIASVLPVLISERGQGIDLPLDQLVRIDFTAAGYELIDLARLPMTVLRQGDAFGLVFEPQIKSGRLHAHAPAMVRFDLPDAVRRLSATAELDVDATMDSAQIDWAEFELIVRIDGEEAGRWQISGSQMRTPINVELPEGANQLTFELDPAVNGPILDRLRLRDATLLRDRSSTRSADDG